MVEALGIIIDRRPKERTRKMKINPWKRQDVFLFKLKLKREVYPDYYLL